MYEKIQRNLDQKISLNQLAFFSNYSYFHFHRIFKSSTGESIKQHITRLRLEKSAFELRISNMPIIEIALEAGFGSHEAFSRAFKKQFRVSPSDYRKKHSLTLRSHQKLNSEILGVPESIKLEEIYCKEIESFRIAYVRKFGSYQELPGPLPKAKETKAILKFMEDFKLAPNNHKWVGISNDDPSITKNKNIRFDLGITVGNLFPTTGKVGFQLIKGGRFAIARHRGSYSKLEEVYRFLIHDYPQLSRMKIRNERPFEVYLNPFLLEKLPITDIYIPIH